MLGEWVRTRLARWWRGDSAGKIGWPVSEPVSVAERAVLVARGLPVPERWIDQFPHPVPCRWDGPDPGVGSVSHRPFYPVIGPAPEMPMARQLRDGSGLFHLWDARRGLLRDWINCSCPPIAEEELGAPVATVLVPHAARCWPRQPGWAGHVSRARLRIGPLRRQWPHKVIPRAFVWWRLFELQGGRCALCWNPAAVIDHEHDSGAVRALLCWRCNGQEGMYRIGRVVCVHRPPYCFEEYRANPPAASFGWVWPVSPMTGQLLGTFRHAHWPDVAEPLV